MSVQRILVPTDFSIQAEYAAEVAADIARKNNAELYLLHAMQIPVYESNTSIADYQNMPEAIFFLKLARQKFEEFRAKPFFKDVNLKEVIQMENTYELIVGNAEKHNIDLIVMGSKGSTGLNDVLIGSNTEKVIRRSKCPVLTVKSKMDGFNPQNVAFFSSFATEYQGVFKKALDVLAGFNVNFHFVHVITPRNFESSNTTLARMEDFKNHFNRPEIQIHIQNAETIEEGAFEFGERISVDLRVLGTHGRTGLSHMMFGSITEDIANQSKLPVLSIKI